MVQHYTHSRIKHTSSQKRQSTIRKRQQPVETDTIKYPLQKEVMNIFYKH